MDKVSIYFRQGKVGGHAFHPRLMSALERELTVGLGAVFPLPDTVSVRGPFYVLGDTVCEGLPYDVHGPLLPVFALSEPVELAPPELAKAVLELLDPDSDTGNEWLQPKVGLASEVRSAMDVLARRLARLSGQKVVPA